MTVLTALIIGVLAAGIAACVNFYTTGLWPVRDLCLIVFGIAAGSTLLIQTIRVLRSIMRDSRGDIRPTPVSLLSMESNSVWTIMLPIVVAALSLLAIGPRF